MSGDHARRQIVIGDKTEGSGRNNERTPSRELGDKYKEEFCNIPIFKSEVWNPNLTPPPYSYLFHP
jgi:hypothetical protein